MIRNISKLTHNRFAANIFFNVLRWQECKPKNLKNYVHVFKYISFSFINFVYVAKSESPPISQNIISREEQAQINMQMTIKQADELFSMGKFEESFNLLQTLKDTNNVEVLWRISRALYNMSKVKGIDKKQNVFLIEEAYKYIEQAMELNSQHYAVHKWMAILYDSKYALQGIKARIKALPVFKEHLLKAIELNPKDATSIYMLGLYMYNLADMSKFQRVIAKSLFGTPPEATFEEAFYYFNKAEEVEPNFYSSNLLMLGKTCLKLKRIESARFWLKCASSYPVTTDEDEAVRIEAEELLKKNPGVTETTYESAEQNTQ